MDRSRRQFLTASGMALAGATLASKDLMAQSGHEGHQMKDPHAGHDMGMKKMPKAKIIGDGKYSTPMGNSFYARSVDPMENFSPGEPGKDYTPVVVPNGSTLPFKIVDGIKIFHLTAEEVFHEFAPGLKSHCWGYNGQVHGPVIEAVEGDNIRIYVTNKLEVPTTVHWHGLILPMGMDGVAGLTQRTIKPGETFKYEYKIVQHGTFMYHSHKDTMTQEGMGLMGMFIVHPRKPKRERPDRDFVLLMSEWDIKPGTYRPDTTVASGFNTLTLNAKVFPGTEPLVCKLNEKIRIRVGNLSAMDHHPFHLHGHAFKVTETDGGEIPEAGQWPETTVLVSVGQTRNIEFVADNPGDWAMHCHMTHHVMNQMGHGLPNMVGIKTKGLDRQVSSLLPGYMTMGANGMGDMGQHAQHMDMPENSIPMMGTQGLHDYIGMGGMFTVFKVRDDIETYDDPGWYKPPEGTLVGPATSDELARDGINV